MSTDRFREETLQPPNDYFYFNCPKVSIPGTIDEGLDIVRFNETAVAVVDGKGNRENRLDVDGDAEIFSMDILYKRWGDFSKRYLEDLKFRDVVGKKTYIRFEKKQLWSLGGVTFEGYGRQNIFLMSDDPKRKVFALHYPTANQRFYREIGTFIFSVPKGTHLLIATDGGMDALAFHPMFKDFRTEDISVNKFNEVFDPMNDEISIRLATICQSLFRPLFDKLYSSFGKLELKRLFIKAQRELPGTINDDATVIIKTVT